MTSSNCSAAPSSVLVEEEPPRLETIGSRPPHPTARAFFQALDSKNLQNLSTKQTKTTPRKECHDDDEDLPNQSEQNLKQSVASPASNVNIQQQHTTSSSSWIQKRIQTLGWRNRYSQADQYPIHLMDASHQFFFSVRQVQRGEVDGTYGTGATVWPASLVLLYYLQHLHHQQQQQLGKSNQMWMNSVDTNQNNNDDDLVIVELGAGTGVVSIGAALLFGQQQQEQQQQEEEATTSTSSNTTKKGSTTTIICTDGCHAVVQLARDNIEQAARQLQLLLLESQQEQQEQTSNDETNVAQQQQHHYIDKNSNPSKNSDSPSSLADPDQTQTPVENQISYQSHDPNSIVATIQGCPVIVKQYWWGTKPLPTETTATILPVSSAHASTTSSSATTAAYASSLATNETTMSSHRDNSVPPTIISPRTLVLVSDCVLPKLYPIAPLVDALDQLLLHPQRDVAYISYEHRYYPEYDPRDKFRELCQVKGLQVTAIPIEEQHPIYSVEEDIELWNVRRL